MTDGTARFKAFSALMLRQYAYKSPPGLVLSPGLVLHGGAAMLPAGGGGPGAGARVPRGKGG